MADLANLRECASYIGSWRSHYGENYPLLRNRLRRTADDLERLVGRMESSLRWGTAPDDYESRVAELRRSVALLRATADDEECSPEPCPACHASALVLVSDDDPDCHRYSCVVCDERVGL